MARLNLTLRTLLAYLDDTLDPHEARQLGEKVAESESALELIERIKKVTRRRGLHIPVASGPDDHLADPNRVAEYLSDNLSAADVAEFEETCLSSDVHLAEAAACHQILTLVLTEPVRVPPTANQRMYKLVEAPASVQHRKPGRTLPIGGLPEQLNDSPEVDVAEAALLLGMGRYAQSEPRWNRIALSSAVGALAVILVIAVFMALPTRSPDQPSSNSSEALAQVAPPKNETTPTRAEPITPKPVPAEPSKPIVIGDALALAPLPREVVDPPLIKIPDEPIKKPGDIDAKREIPAPRAERAKMGRLDTENVIVLSRQDGVGDWRRFTQQLEPDITSGDMILCLPGYKANLLLDSKVGVHLWGNVPEILPDPLYDVRIQFHLPPKSAEKNDAIDADLTLYSGRIYLTSRKAGSARVRVRIVGEVWDVTLPDDKSEVMIQIIREFVPGTAFFPNVDEKPRVDLRAVVNRGKASIRIQARDKDFANLAAQSLISWDNISGRVTNPEPVKKEELGRYDRVFLLPDAEKGKQVQRALADVVTNFTDRDGVRLLLAELLAEKLDPNKAYQVRFAIYDQASLLNGDPEANGLKILLERAGETERPFARTAAVTALANWIAQASGNSTRLQNMLVKDFKYTDQDATLVNRLLRGYLPLGPPNPDDLDRLIGFLGHPSVIVRELTLWNLFTFIDPEGVKVPGLFIDVGDNASPRYERFLKAWKNRGEEIKNAVAKKP